MRRQTTIASLGLGIALSLAASGAHAQCEEENASPLADVASAVAEGLAEGPSDGYSTDPEIARVQKMLLALSGFSAKLSSSALLDAAFQDGRFSKDDAEAFLELRTGIMDAWADARIAEDFFWGLDGEEPVSPWQVDERWMHDVRTILRELGPRMDADARALLERIVKIAETSEIPEPALEDLRGFLDARPTNPMAVEQFDRMMEAAYTDWQFEMYPGPNGYWRRAFLVEAATDPELRAFAERADASGNKDGKVDLDEMTVTKLMVRMERMFGTRAELILHDTGRNFARVKDGKFEIHLSRETPAHDIEGVLAHEYGHVLLARHDKNRGSTRREREAEADYVSGWIHGKLVYDLDTSGFGWVSRRWKYNAEDPDHGDFRTRVDTVGIGYRDATGKDLFEKPDSAAVPGTPRVDSGAAFDP